MLPKHLAHGGMLFLSLGISKSRIPFSIIILIGSHQMHHWSRRLLVWGSNCRALVSKLKVCKLGRTAKQQINLPLSWLAITIRYRWRRLNTCSKRIHVSNGRCKHFCHQHAVPQNQWQREIWWVQKESLNEGFYAVEVEITDTMEHLEDPDWKKSSQTCPSVFAPTNTSIAKLLAGIPWYHSTVGEITVQD